MAVSCSKAGRPRFVADITFSDDTQLAVRREFYAVCSDFRYRDIVAVSRACGVHACTVERWKYGLHFPQKDIAQQVIDWVKAGKPMRQERPFPETFSML